jgi:hypothetical protein
VVTRHGQDRNDHAFRGDGDAQDGHGSTPTVGQPDERRDTHTCLIDAVGGAITWPA